MSKAGDKYTRNISKAITRMV